MPRPRKHLRPTDYDRLEDMASVGASMRTIAKRLGVAYVTFQKILQRDKRAKAAFEAGRGQLQTDLVKCLYEAAVNKGNIVAAIYLTKAMCGFTDQPQPQPQESRVKIEIRLPRALTEQQYRKLIDVTPKALKEAGVGAA